MSTKHASAEGSLNRVTANPNAMCAKALIELVYARRPSRQLRAAAARVSLLDYRWPAVLTGGLRPALVVEITYAGLQGSGDCSAFVSIQPSGAATPILSPSEARDQGDLLFEFED